MKKVTRIKYYNRAAGRVEFEKIYGEKGLKLLYERSFLRLLHPLIMGNSLSKFFGKLQDRPRSCRKIKRFVREFQIAMEEFLPSNPELPTGYKSFNDFFIRKFRPGARPFCSADAAMAAFAEARYLGFAKSDAEQLYPIKNKFLTPELMLNNHPQWSATFQGGPLLIARLCPTDYHRFHFPDAGTILDHYLIEGPLHSVSPIALKYKPDILATNERQVTILETKNFGKLAYIEIGALCVGKIVQNYHGTTFERGDEKGHFLFGGSTVVVLGEAGKWQPCLDILVNSQQNLETLVRLGDQVATLWTNTHTNL